MNLAYRAALMSGGARPALNLDFTSGVLDSRITFSRASNATLTDSTGKITYAPNNLLTYSQEFDNAAWAKSGATVTPNTTIAPDGTQTADTVVFSGASQLIRANSASSILGITVTGSVYVKGTAGETIAISVGGADQLFTLDGSWQRIFLTRTSTIATVGVFNLNTYSGATARTIFVWGAQLEAVTYQTTPSTYNATTTAAYYGPRFDYDPVTLAAKGLLIEEARTNLATYSEQFDNAVWVKSNTTVTANATTAPDGTSTADKLVEDVALAAHFIDQAFTPANATTYTCSVYLKPAGRNYAFVGFKNGSMATTFISINLINGTVSTATGVPVASSVSSVGNGWYRATITLTSTGTVASTIDIRASVDGVWANRIYTGDGTSGLFVWGAQLEVGAFATSYIPTVASTVARSADIATMTGTNFSSWFNQGPVNLALQSQTFDNASWVKTATTASADATTAPDGTTTADRIAEDATTASHNVQQSISFTAGVAYTMSVYVKKGSGATAPDIIQSTFNAGAFGTQYANFNISTGVVTASVGGTAAITAAGSGWYRISWTATCTTTGAGFILPISFCNNNPTATRAPSYAGATTSDVFVWGAQLEVGSTATAYIPTTTVPAASPPAVGTFVTKADAYSVTAYGPLVVARNSGTALQNRIDLSTNAGVATQTSRLTVVTGSVTQADPVVIGPTITPNVAYTFAGAFATNDFISASQGSLSPADTSGTVPAVDILEIGNRTPSGAAQLNGHLQYIKYYPTRLSDNTLQQLTR